jgi:hypothetical protein
MLPVTIYLPPAPFPLHPTEGQQRLTADGHKVLALGHLLHGALAAVAACREKGAGALAWAWRMRVAVGCSFFISDGWLLLWMGGTARETRWPV